MGVKSKALGVLLVACFATAAFFLWKWRIVDSATVPYAGSIFAGDFYGEIYPGTKRAGEWIRAGILPLWNPYQFCGHPYLATGIYGVLYPLNFLHLFMPAEVAIEATIVLHLAIAGVLMYAFTRVFGLSRLAAIGGGVLFMWSGFLVGEALWFPPAVASGTWLPLGLLAVEKIVRTRRVAWSVPLGAAIALSFMAGWPQTWMYSLWALVLFAAVRLVATLRVSVAHALHGAALVAVGFVLSGGLMAVQLLPQLELQRLGPRRVGGLSEEQAITFAPISTKWFLGQTLSSIPSDYQGGYVGIATLLLVALSLFAVRKRATVAVFWVIALFSAGVALGTQSPLFWVHRMLPGMAWFRGAQRILYLYAFACAFLGAVGIDALVGERAPLSVGRRRVMLGVVIVLAVAAYVLSTMPPQSVVYLGCAVVLLGAALLVGDARWRSVVVVALLALVAWDLYHAEYNRYQHPYHDISGYDDEGKLWSFVESHQNLERTYIKIPFNLPSILAKQGTIRGVYSITDYEPLTLRRYERFYRLLESTHRPSAFTFMGDLRGDPTIPGFSLIDLMSVRYIIAPPSNGAWRQPLDDLTWKWRPRIELRKPGGQMLYENTNVLPRSYVAYLATYAVTEDEAFDAVAAPGFQPRTTVVIEGPGTSAPVDSTARFITPARIIRYDPTEVVIEADAKTPGHLVLTDTFYPGWYATVDGEETPILQANYLFRAVPLDAGRHTVVFRYTPTSFRLGLTLTMLSLLTAAAIIIRDRRRR